METLSFGEYQFLFDNTGPPQDVCLLYSQQKQINIQNDIGPYFPGFEP
jgi:hypothetical protein